MILKRGGGESLRTTARLRIRSLLSGGNNPSLLRVSIEASFKMSHLHDELERRKKGTSPEARNHPTSAGTRRESCLSVPPLPAAS